MMGQVRRSKQPGPAAVEIIELPKPRPKEGGAGVLASVHAIAEERRPKIKTKTEIKTEEAEAEQATHRQEEESRWAADAKAASAVQGQVSDLARMVKELQQQRISTNREIKYQHVWVEGKLEERAMAAQVEQVKGSVSELASELAAVREQARELASRELAAVREQQQAKCTTGKSGGQVYQADCTRLSALEAILVVGSKGLTGQVRDLKVQQRAAVAQEEERMGVLEAGLAAQVQQAGERMGALEAGLAAQVQSAEESMATVAQVEARMGILELMTGRSFIESFRAVAELNEDIERLYEESPGTLVEERLTPDGEGWYTEQEFNRFFIVR
jgi:hypothetical protein